MRRYALPVALVCSLSPAASAKVTVDGVELPVFDPHLHFGKLEHMPQTAREFVARITPGFIRPYVPAIVGPLTSPYGAMVGVAEQLRMAGVDHGVLLATYTHATTGYATNTDLLGALLDARNDRGDGQPLFYGMVSINFEGFTPAVAKHRIDAVRSFVVKYPRHVVGIKLAHPHQGVALDDPLFHGVYDLAAELGVPVLLHTGFSPFPGAREEREFYDPAFLAPLVARFSGNGGNRRLDFIFGHTGQGDLRSVDAALQMCRDNPNVYVELSALGGPFLIGEAGKILSETEQQSARYRTQLPYVLAQVKALGLVDRALFASDGPQFSGKIRSYVRQVVDEMKAAGFSVDEMKKVLHDNAVRILLGDR